MQWGFKMWCRCNSTSGYLFQFNLYTGKKTGHVEQGLGESVVLSLTAQIKISNARHTSTTSSTLHNFNLIY